MTSWRDIADQLTVSQVDLLEWLEGDPLNGLLAGAEQHLEIARAWASENLEQSFHADVAPPADAVEVGPWRKPKSRERCRSYRSVTVIGGVDIALEIHGFQYTDGRVECRIALTGALDDLDSAATREVAAALIAAADLMESR
jgi:hypothetical protein